MYETYAQRPDVKSKRSSSEFAMEKARRGTKRIVVGPELLKEVYNERNETGAFSELKKRQGIWREELREREPAQPGT